MDNFLKNIQTEGMPPSGVENTSKERGGSRKDA